MKNFIKKLLFREEKLSTRIFKFIKKPWVIVLVVILVIVGIKFSNGDTNEGDNTPEQKIVKNVKTINVNPDAQYSDTINTVGTVKAETNVDVVALTKGTVRGVYFEVGDKVYKNKVLANLFNSSSLTSYNNAQTNLSNAQNSLESTKLIADESVKQAEIGIENALESVKSAEIALKSAQDNLANAISLQSKGKEDAKENAITAFYSFLNTANTTLDQINYIIKAEGNDQIEGIEHILGVQDLSSVPPARSSYLSARQTYDNIFNIQPTKQTVRNNLEQAISLLSLTVKAVDNTIIVLNNTISSADFSDITLNAQKSSFANLRSTIIGSKTSAEQTLQGLESLDPLNKQEMDALENAVNSALNGINLAQIGYDNAVVTLESAKQGKEQQIIGSQTSVDSAQGQLNIIGTQVSDLTVIAPIAGTVTKKYVELGAEINPGQKIAEISQTDKVKIEINLASEDIYRVQVGQAVTIRKDLSATITLIDPAADPVTRKVRVEILFNNENKELITGTFVDVNIPVEELEKTNSESVFIPLQTVTITQNENIVFTVVDGKAKKMPVVIGKTEGSLIEILTGLNNGDVLVIEGNKSLEDGDEVRVNN